MNEEEEKGFSIYPILGVFLALGALGLAGVLLLSGTGSSPTEQLPRDPTTSTTSTTGPPGESTASFEFPDGSALPDRISSVEVSPGQWVYTYKIPASFLEEPNRAETSPALAEPASGGAAVALSMACTISAGSLPAQITVLEDPLQVRIIPVAIGHTLGEPCPPLESIENITLPLEEPIGTRQLVVDAPGTVVNLD